MSSYVEVLLTTESSGQLCNICVWDITSGTQLVAFKGDSSAPRTLCLLKHDYILSAVYNKTLLHVWSLQRKDQIQHRVVCPGRVTALATSPDGMYCLAGINEKLHIWQVATGNLVAILSSHYQNISCVQFTDDGSHFVSGGEDNLVLVWSLASVLSDKTSEGQQPMYTWSKHSLPITDVHVGCGALMARVWTASLDNTVRMWDMASGDLLSTFIFDNPIMSVITDPAEMRLFAGASTGKIYQLNLFEKPAKAEHHLSEDTAPLNIFTGHNKHVTCMAVTMDGIKLISGSKDMCVKIWDIISKQCLKTLFHKGSITNIKLIQPPKCLLSHDSDSRHVRMPLPSFKRQLSSNQSSGQEEQETREKYAITTKQRELSSIVDEAFFEECLDELEKLEHGAKQDPKEVQKELMKQIGHLQRVNNDIYHFTVSEILRRDPHKQKN